ncbi:WD40 repeat-like protein [Imleria badia]|nr:WD40 repeat-like protein [Imleria badia]
MSSTIPQQSDNDGPRPHLVISGHDCHIYALTYLPDGQRVVTGSLDGTVKVWNVGNGEQERTSMEHKDEVESLVVTRDGTKIISGDTGGRIKVWDVESHELVREWTHKGRCFMIAVSPDDRLIAVGDDDVGIYTMEGKQVNNIKVTVNDSEGLRSVSFSPDGKKLACGTDDDIYVYDVDTGTLVLRPLKGHKDSVFSVLWSRDGSRLFSESDDKTIRCWNSDTGEQIGQPWTGHTHWIRSLSLSPDESILASASWDETVRFWDATSGQPVGQPLQHDEGVTAVCFSPSGEFVASAGWGGKLYLWRVPWLDSVESRTGHATIAMTTCNAVHYAQPPFFHAPSPYYMHFPSADQVLDRDPGVSISRS